MEIERARPERVRRSRHLSVFGHQGDVFLYHDLYGFILEMSADVLEFLEAFGGGADVAAVVERFDDRFEGASAAGFADVFWEFCCLVPEDGDEVAQVLRYYPVKSKWNVWHRGDDDRVTLITAWGERPVSSLTLSEAETAIWDALDPDTPLAALTADHDVAVIQNLVVKLVHNDVQALKLSQFPFGFYRGRADLQPPYLTSTMPYAPLAQGDGSAPLSQRDDISPTTYYQHDISDADAQFDHQETTLSHLLREPHPAIANRTYGQAVIDALAERDAVPAQRARVLEVGGGLGFFAKAVTEALAERNVEVDYTIVDLAPALAAKQRECCAGLPVTVREADVLATELVAASYELIFANEMVGDLPAVKLNRDQLAKIQADEPADEHAEAARLIAAYDLCFDDAPEWFYFTTGALQLIEKIAAALAPEGTGFVTEFGEYSQYPRLSRHLDHPELSIHFGWLEQVATALGLETEYVFVIDLLDMDRELEGMATTRSYFRALAALLANHGATLHKIGYTRAMFDQLIAGKLDAERFGDVYFDKIEDRLMGLVPHEFKALIVRRPG